MNVASEVVVVVGHGAADVRAELGAPARVHVVANPAPERGQLSSLQVGAEVAMRLGASKLPIRTRFVERHELGGE